MPVSAVSVGRAPVPSPDDRRSITAEGACGLNGALDVAIADIAEDAAHQQYVGRQRVGESVDQACVCMADLYLRQTHSGSRLPGQRDVARVRFDQDSPDLAAARMARQCSEDVATLPGAQADQLHPVRGSVVDGIRQARLDAPQPDAQQRRGIVIACVPGHPVLHSSIVASPARQPLVSSVGYLPGPPIVGKGLADLPTDPHVRVVVAGLKGQDHRRDPGRGRAVRNGMDHVAPDPRIRIPDELEQPDPHPVIVGPDVAGAQVLARELANPALRAPGQLQEPIESVLGYAPVGGRQTDPDPLGDPVPPSHNPDDSRAQMAGPRLISPAGLLHRLGRACYGSDASDRSDRVPFYAQLCNGHGSLSQRHLPQRASGCRSW